MRGIRAIALPAPSRFFFLYSCVYKISLEIWKIHKCHLLEKDGNINPQIAKYNKTLYGITTTDDRFYGWKFKNTIFGLGSISRWVAHRLVFSVPSSYLFLLLSLLAPNVIIWQVLPRETKENERDLYWFNRAEIILYYLHFQSVFYCNIIILL